MSGALLSSQSEMSVIKSENETISHHYTHHVLLMAAVPVICAFIGTTQLGWNFGDGTVVKLSMLTGLALAVLFYAVMLAGVAVMGRVIWWMARTIRSGLPETLHGVCRLCRHAAVPQRDCGALSAGLAVRAGRYHRAVLHRLSAVSRYPDLPEH
jgi:hypothetical protein